MLPTLSNGLTVAFTPLISGANPSYTSVTLGGTVELDKLELTAYLGVTLSAEVNQLAKDQLAAQSRVAYARVRSWHHSERQTKAESYQQDKAAWRAS